jgi:hypothetical protein
MNAFPPDIRDVISDARNAYIDSISHPDPAVRTKAAKDYTKARTKVAFWLDTDYKHAEKVILCLEPAQPSFGS